jgi:serine/threonine protein phosphatase 1
MKPNSERHYVIGDIHGNYKTLLALVDKLPTDATLVFVGDLIDRGLRSREVINFVRENNHLCVLGNHEQFMIESAAALLTDYPYSANLPSLHEWYQHGGIQTLISYGLMSYNSDGELECIVNKEGLKQFHEDTEWLKSLPLYIELPLTVNDRDVVISHSACGNVWQYRNKFDQQDIFIEHILWRRQLPNIENGIFNIFGHTPQQHSPTIEELYANIDTGCYAKAKGYNQLCAFCVETQEVISQENMDRE